MIYRYTEGRREERKLLRIYQSGAGSVLNGFGHLHLGKYLVLIVLCEQFWNCVLLGMYKRIKVSVKSKDTMF